MEKKNNEPRESMLTQHMDTGTQGFNEFQAILLEKSKHRSDLQKRNIELLALRFQMEVYVEKTYDSTKSAGEFLKEVLKTIQIPQNKFADYIGIKPSNLSKLIKGERPINYDLALIFGRIFNHNPMLWIEIQAKNEMQRLNKIEKNKYSNYSLNGLIQRTATRYHNV